MSKNSIRTSVIGPTTSMGDLLDHTYIFLGSSNDNKAFFNGSLKGVLFGVKLFLQKSWIEEISYRILKPLKGASPKTTCAAMIAS